eukprot:scpid90006/ scgid8326/ 
MYGVSDIAEHLDPGQHLNKKEAEQVCTETEAEGKDLETIQNPNSPTSATGCPNEQCTPHSRSLAPSSEAHTDQAKELGKHLNPKEAKQVCVETEAEHRDSQTIQDPNSPASTTGCPKKQSKKRSRSRARSSKAKTDQGKEGCEQSPHAAKEEVVTDTTGECDLTGASSPARKRCKRNSPRQSVLYHTCRQHQYFTLPLPVSALMGSTPRASSGRKGGDRNVRKVPSTA